jgi:nucleoside-diphosphate-sugar epimerase
MADRAPSGSAINVASGVEVSVGDVLAALVRLANVEVTVSQRGDAAPGVSRCVADVTLLRDLGFHRLHGMDQSLRDLLEWYRQLEPPHHRGV